MGLDSTEVRERECVCVCLKDPSVTGMFAYTHHWGLTDAFWPRRSALRCPPGRRPGGVCRGRRCLSDNTEKKDRPREQISTETLRSTSSKPGIRSSPVGHQATRRTGWVYADRGVDPWTYGHGRLPSWPWSARVHRAPTPQPLQTS